MIQASSSSARFDARFGGAKPGSKRGGWSLIYALSMASGCGTAALALLLSIVATFCKLALPMVFAYLVSSLAAEEVGDVTRQYAAVAAYLVLPLLGSLASNWSGNLYLRTAVQMKVRIAITAHPPL